MFDRESSLLGYTLTRGGRMRRATADVREILERLELHYGPQEPAH